MSDWREAVASLPVFAPLSLDVDRQSTALVVIDLQYLDAHRDYGIGPFLKDHHPALHDYYFERLERCVVPNVKRLLAAFRAARLRVIYLTLGSELADAADIVPLRRPQRSPTLAPTLFARGSFEHAILPELQPQSGELVINKTSRSPFNSTAIERVLRNLGIETLVLAGVTTSACVETTARDASDRGFQVVVVEDATAEYDADSHEASLRLLALRWGQIWTTDDAVRLAGDGERSVPSQRRLWSHA